MTHEETGVPSSVFLLAATCMGAGALAMPYAFLKLGAAEATILLACIGMCTVYTMTLMIRLGTRFNARSYEELGVVVFKRRGRGLISSFIGLMIFGALVAFIDIASDTLLISMEYLLGEHAFFTHRLVVTCGVTYCVILPLSLLRNIDQLEKASYAAVGILVAFTGCMVVNGIYLALNRYASQEGQKVEYFQADTDFLEGISIIALAYTAQANIFPIFLQLRMRSELRMRTVVRAAMALVSVAYWFGGFFGYMGYLDVTEGDVLNNLPESAFWSAWRLLVCVAIILHYPIVHFGLRTSIENSVFTGQSFSWKRHIMMTMVVVTCSMIAAIIMPGLDVIVAFTGAVAGFPLMFVFPCLFYIKSHTRDGHIKASIRPLVKTDQKVEGAYGAVPSEDLEDTTTEGLVPDAAWEYTFCAVMAFFSIGLTVVATGYTSYKIVTKFAEAEVE